ncbi:MAG TPA: M23 family metallopeptidase [Myxococcota bacterium]|nr:M23 family metallopeptidase [Myxococcota bacterium]
MRAALALAGALAAFAVAPTPAAGSEPEASQEATPTPEQRAAAMRAWCEGSIEHSIRYHHLDPASLDHEAICAPVMESFAAGMPRREVEAVYHAQIRKLRFAFATPGAAHDRSTRYRFPFEPWMPRLLSQTSGGETHDTPDQYHAFDFLMPRGTKVLAAREGTVVYVADGTPPGVPGDVDGGNVVDVLHGDGTWASYVHLKAGIPVKVGQRVRRGEPIASSGNTGFSRVPHLHFNVQRMDLSGEVLSVPIRFGAPGKTGQRLEAGHHYGKIPRSRRELRVRVDGRLADAEVPIPIGYGARPDVRVELVEPGGGVRDVTRDPRMRYETMTLWNVYSPALGEVVIEAVPDIDLKYVRKALPLLNQSEGLLFVYHGVPWDEDFGLARVVFQVLPAPP